MTIAPVQKAAIEEIVDIIVNMTSSGRGKRQLSTMFMDLVDKEAWPEYYKVIPEPRCISGVQDMLGKSKYRDALEVFADLRLVFMNALFYNTDGSQISKDAATLKAVLQAEWKKRAVLPTPATSPPPAASSVPDSAAPQIPQPSTPQPVSFPEPQPAPAPKSPAYQPAAQRASSPDMDVDIGGGSPEPEGVIEDMTRDAESDEIVKQLERGLPRWQGFGDKGWMPETSPDTYMDIVVAIKSHKDIIGNRVATVMDSLPEESTIKDLSYNYPLSLKTIEGRVRIESYASTQEFDMDFARLFEKGRRWYEIGSEQYGSVLLLQRLYQALTSSSPPLGPPYSSQTNFASLRAGPGTARPLHAAHNETDGVPGVTTFRVSSKDRQFVDEVDYRGYSVHLADWLHLANPDDPSRPIVAQVFKCWVSDEVSKKGQPGVTVCWYYRPEQTVHPAHRQFWEGEVFKTGHFADHPLDDIIEKIACQFTARHIRGRPRPPFWYPGWPLYVCDSRYNDRERVFVKIKNWNSCVPEEVRKSTEFMPIYPFERTVFPRRFGSPFLIKQKGGGRGAKFPGGIGDSVERADGEKIEGGGTGRKRVRRTGGAGTPKLGRTDEVGPSKGLYVGASTPGAPTNQTASLYPHSAFQSQHHAHARRTEDRSIITAAGGVTSLGENVAQEKLPTETAKHFDRDPDTNEVLWFSGPPIDVARTPAPRYSLNYLHHLATKRKTETQAAGESNHSNGHNSNAKRPRLVSRPTVTETLESLWSSFWG